MLARSIVPFAPDEKRQALLLPHLDPIDMPAGAQLFAQGEAADAVYFIEQGQLAVMLEVAGVGRVPVRVFGTGESVGEMALYRHEIRAATVEALTDAKLWRLTAESLNRLEETQPQLAIALHRHVTSLLAERVAFTNTELKEPLAQLAHAIGGLAAGQFSESAWDRAATSTIASRPDEVGAVASALEFLEAQLRAYIQELQRTTAAKARIEHELKIAGRIQSSFLPPPMGADERARINFEAATRPARDAGGDLYDGFFIDDRRFFFVIGDVSGKGIAAALFMAVTATCVRAMAGGLTTTGEMITHVNRMLCQRNDTMQFVTAFTGVLDTTTRELLWSDCGHLPVYVVGPDGVRASLESDVGPPLAVFEAAEYPTFSRQLAPDEMLVLYTDGVTEATNGDGDFFEDSRLLAILNTPEMSANPKGCVDRILTDVLAFTGSAPQADDITIVTVRQNIN